MSKGPQITDLPIWSDCPFWELVPEEIEIRLGVFGGEAVPGRGGEQTVLAFWWSKYQLHIAMDFDSLDPTSMDKTVEVVISNLTGAQFNKEYPGIFDMIIKARVNQTMGHPIPSSLLPAIARMEELDRLIPRAVRAHSSPSAASAGVEGELSS